ncbi:MAG: AraC family transcriptional regulator [Methylomonas sp.]|nr:AraC family transcriptional regulator [Methylomonas sp.]
MMQVSSSATTFRINNEELPWLAMPEEGCQYQGLPEALGSGCSRLFMLEADFSLIETQYVPARSLAVYNRIDSQEPRMVLTLGLTGCSSFNERQGREIAFKAGFSTLTAFNSSAGWRQYQSNQPVTQLRFMMSKQWVERNFDDSVLTKLFDKNATQVVKQRPILPSSLQLAHCIRNRQVAANAGTLFKQGLAMAIVASELTDLINEPQPNSFRTTFRDKQLAESARDILLAEFAAPPSLAELSHRIGTNQFKLKQVFRHCFDNTVYGMLLDIRMEKAHRLLTDGRYTVGLAAEAVGYAHASNISAAFTRYFGFPPKSLAHGRMP